MGLSACVIHRVLKVVRTVADLEGEERVRESQIAEALQYRSLVVGWQRSSRAPTP